MTVAHTVPVFFEITIVRAKTQGVFNLWSTAILSLNLIKVTPALSCHSIFAERNEDSEISLSS